MQNDVHMIMDYILWNQKYQYVRSEIIDKFTRSKFNDILKVYSDDIIKRIKIMEMIYPNQFRIMVGDECNYNPRPIRVITGMDDILFMKLHKEIEKSDDLIDIIEYFLYKSNEIEHNNLVRLDISFES